MDSKGVNDALDFEWANVPGSKFLGWDLEGDILRQEPDVLSWMVISKVREV